MFTAINIVQAVGSIQQYSHFKLEATYLLCTWIFNLVQVLLLILTFKIDIRGVMVLALAMYCRQLINFMDFEQQRVL